MAKVIRALIAVGALGLAFTVATLPTTELRAQQLGWCYGCFWDEQKQEVYCAQPASDGLLSDDICTMAMCMVPDCSLA